MYGSSSGIPMDEDPTIATQEADPFAFLKAQGRQISWGPVCGNHTSSPRERAQEQEEAGEQGVRGEDAEEDIDD